MRHVARCAIVLCTLMLTAEAGARSRYAPLLGSPGGRDTLRSLALWEDQRVTGDGALFDYLRSGDPLVRLRTVEVIGRIQDEDDAARLIPLLSDADQRVSDAAVFALGQIGSPEATPALIELAGGVATDRLPLILEALGKIGDPASVDALIGRLHDYNGSVRREAALALARAESPDAIDALLIAAEDPDARVAWRAIYALEKVESGKVGDRIVKFLEHDDPVVRARTARTLGKQDYTKGTKALVAVLKDDAPRVVINAAVALGALGSRRAVRPLGEVLEKHASHHARRAAAEALGEIGQEKAEDHLIRGMLDRSTGVRVACVVALAKCLGDDAGLYIGQGLNDGAAAVRRAAVEAIGEAELEERLDDLFAFAEKDDDPSVRATALIALGKFDDERVGPLLVSRLADEDWVAVTCAVTAIAEREYAEATDALVDIYRARDSRRDADVRIEVLNALQAVDAREHAGAIALLRECVSDRDPRIRSIAADALAAWELEFPPPPDPRDVYETFFDRSRLADLAPPTGTGRAAIETPHGEIEVELFGDDAPQTVASFIALAKKGFYDGLTFHRVVPNFVIQGGCPRGDGWGDPGYNIRSEFNPRRYETGYIGIAHSGKDTGGSQFFITMSPQHHLDGRYTIFGRVTKGMDAVMKVDQGDRFEVRVLE